MDPRNHREMRLNTHFIFMSWLPEVGPTQIWILRVFPRQPAEIQSKGQNAIPCCTLWTHYRVLEMHCRLSGSHKWCITTYKIMNGAKVLPKKIRHSKINTHALCPFVQLLPINCSPDFPNIYLMEIIRSCHRRTTSR